MTQKYYLEVNRITGIIETAYSKLETPPADNVHFSFIEVDQVCFGLAALIGSERALRWTELEDIYQKTMKAAISKPVATTPAKPVNTKSAKEKETARTSLMKQLRNRGRK